MLKTLAAANSVLGCFQRIDDRLEKKTFASDEKQVHVVWERRAQKKTIETQDEAHFPLRNEKKKEEIGE